MFSMTEWYCMIKGYSKTYIISIEKNNMHLIKFNYTKGALKCIYYYSLIYYFMRR